MTGPRRSSGASSDGGQGEPGRDADAQARAARLEKEAHELATQVSFLEEEVAMLRRKLTESPRQVRVLEERLAAAQQTMAQLTARTTSSCPRSVKRATRS